MPKKRRPSPRTTRTPKATDAPRSPARPARKPSPASARPVSRRRPVVSSDDFHETVGEVFLASPPCSGVAPYATMLNTPDEDDDVFVAAPGAPVAPVAADWVDDTGLTNTEFWQRVDHVLTVAGPPRAGTPMGWTPDELRAHGLDVDRGHVRCRYGCGGTTANVVGVAHHAHDCEYWTREGRNITPF